MADTASNKSTSPFVNVPIEVTISVGKARPFIGDLLKLGKMTFCRSTVRSKTLLSFMSAIA